MRNRETAHTFFDRTDGRNSRKIFNEKSETFLKFRYYKKVYKKNCREKRKIGEFYEV